MFNFNNNQQQTNVLKENYNDETFKILQKT